MAVGVKDIGVSRRVVVVVVIAGVSSDLLRLLGFTWVVVVVVSIRGGLALGCIGIVVTEEVFLGGFPLQP